MTRSRDIADLAQEVDTEALRIDDVPVYPVVPQATYTADHTVTLADIGKMLVVPGNAPGDVTFTMPPMPDVPEGAVVLFFNGGAPKAVINTLYVQVPEGRAPTHRGQRCTFGAINRGGIWSLFGDLADA